VAKWILILRWTLPNFSTSSLPQPHLTQNHPTIYLTPNHQISSSICNFLKYSTFQSKYSCHPRMIFLFSCFFHIHFFLIIKAWIIKPMFHKRSRFSACKQQCHKDVNTLARLNILYIPICDPRICLIKNATFGIWPSLMCHQARRLLHVAWSTCNLLNKGNSPITRAHENSSIEAPTPKC
jgi:hypothetical protein